MRLPSKLLGCMRVGVGVSAVMMGGGCDAIAEAKARVLGEEAAEVGAKTAVDAPAAAPIAAAPASPEPLLLTRDGVAGVVEETVARSKASELETARPTPRPSPVPPVVELGSTPIEPEGSPAFVPYSDATTLASASTPERVVASEKPRTRTRPKLARPVVEDEPCDPAQVAAPSSGWACGPCGRG